MRYLALLLTLLFSAPAIADDIPDGVVAKVAYLGQGQFVFRKKTYDYNGVLAALQDKYSGKQITEVMVDMGTVATEGDKRFVCQFRQSFPGAFVRMYITVDGEKRELYCN